MAKAKVFICLLSLVLLIHNIDASNEFLVESTTCNALNEKSRLQFGDTITYVYEVEKSLVTRVRQEDYIICNAPSSVDVTKSSDYGYSMVKLNQIGPKYSISGIVENNKDKILIHVIAGQRLSPPARAARAQPQAQAQTIGQSEGFLYFSFFTFGFMSCIALLGLCIVLFVLSAVFIAGSIAFAVFNATTSTAVNNATNSSKVNNATNSSKVNNATTSSAVNNATNSSATNSSEVNNETTSSEVNNATTSSAVNNATNSSAVNNADNLSQKEVHGQCSNF